MKHTALITAVILLIGCSGSRDKPQPLDPGMSASTAAANDADMRNQILATHNAWREKTGVPPLSWSNDLAAYALDWANTLKDQGCDIEHRDPNQYGENLAWAGGAHLSPETVVNLWGAEEAFYNYDRNSCKRGEVCGHYTQLVWRDSRSVGCAVAHCSDSEAWVCNYDPPGNVIGEKPY